MILASASPALRVRTREECRARQLCRTRDHGFVFRRNRAVRADSGAATWAAAQQGPFVAPAAPAALSAPEEFQASVYFPQPDTIRFALPKGAAGDQTFRMVVRPDVSMGGPGDYLHPNHGGYLAVGEAIDLAAVRPH
jgi:hypothetical protein